VRCIFRLVSALAVVAVAACSATATQAQPPTSPHAAARYQMGIDLDFYWYKGMRVPRLVKADAAYVRSLGANAVSIAFPFYAHGSTAAAGPGTPPPAVLEQAVSEARSAGLAVYLRPLLNEKNLTNSRVRWAPPSLAGWFRSYQDFLLPYARVAQRGGAAGFYVGTELSDFAHSYYWAALDEGIRHSYHGGLYYSANWQDSEGHQAAGSGGPSATVAVDAYPPMPVPASGFRASWAAWARRLPEGMVLSEVGIAARAGAQYAPYAWAPSDAPFAPQVQPAWFAGACDAVQADHLGGIYFWSVYVGQPLNVAAPQTAYSFVGSPGAAAIKSCFSKLTRA
jgi:glycosyl hydrolase family 113